MKPDWNDAPRKAKWLAMDVYGEWSWFDSKPVESLVRFVLPAFGKTWNAGGQWTDVKQENWKHTLEARP